MPKVCNEKNFEINFKKFYYLFLFWLVAKKLTYTGERQREVEREQVRE